MKRIYLLICVVVLLLFLIAYWYLFFDKTLEIAPFSASNVSITEKSVEFDIVNSESALKIHDYSYTYKEKSLYIKLKGSLSGSNTDNIRTIIIKNDFKDINNIYLIDKHKSKEIW